MLKIIKDPIRRRHAYYTLNECQISYCSALCVFRDLPPSFQIVQHGSDKHNAAIISEAQLWLNISEAGHEPDHPLHLANQAITTPERAALLRLIQQNQPDHIVKVHHVCQCGLVIDIIKGLPLADIRTWPAWHRQLSGALTQRDALSQLTWPEFLGIMADLSEGVHHLHQLGVVHGDLFPFNALVTAGKRGIWIDLNDALPYSRLAAGVDIWAFLVYTLMSRLLKLNSWQPPVIRQLFSIITATNLEFMLKAMSDYLRQTSLIGHPDPELPLTEQSRAELADLYRQSGLQSRPDELGEVVRALNMKGLLRYFSHYEATAGTALAYEHRLAAEQVRHRLVEQELHRILQQRLPQKNDPSQIATWDQLMDQRDELIAAPEYLQQQLAATRQTLAQMQAEYEHRLQSQDLMTRHLLKLTLNNLADTWRHPARLQQKAQRWLAHRLRKPTPAPVSPERLKPDQFTPAEEKWLARTQADQPAAIAVLHPDWWGIRSATGNLFSTCLLVDDTPDAVEGQRLARLLAQTGCRRLVFSGFALNHAFIMESLRRQDQSIKIFVLWHGNFLQSGEDYNWQAFSRIKSLCRQGLIYKWGFVKEGMAVEMAAQGYNTGFVLNYVETIPPAAAPVRPGGPHLGIWGHSGVWRKNPYAMLTACGLITGSTGYLYNARPRDYEFVKTMGLNISLQPQPVPPAEMPHTLPRFDLNLYVTLSECAPMLPLESLAAGVPCLVGPTSHLFKDHPYLHQMLVVPYPDSATAIADYAQRALENRAEIIQAYIDYAPGYNRRAKASLNQFLEL